MTCERLYPSASIAAYPDVPEAPWMTGRLLVVPVPEPLEYRIDPEYPGPPKPMYQGSVPVMRDDLVDSLRECGVDNLQLFRAVIRDPRDGSEHSNYKAFNIVGVVSCADMGQSVLMGTSSSRMIDVDFEGLVIDEARTGGALLSRLAEAVISIVVHDKVKNQLQANGIPGIAFYGGGTMS